MRTLSSFIFEDEEWGLIKKALTYLLDLLQSGALTPEQKDYVLGGAESASNLDLLTRMAEQPVRCGGGHAAGPFLYPEISLLDHAVWQVRCYLRDETKGIPENLPLFEDCIALLERVSDLTKASLAFGSLIDETACRIAEWREG